MWNTLINISYFHTAIYPSKMKKVHLLTVFMNKKHLILLFSASNRGYVSEINKLFSFVTKYVTNFVSFFYKQVSILYRTQFGNILTVFWSCFNSQFCNEFCLTFKKKFIIFVNQFGHIF